MFFQIIALPSHKSELDSEALFFVLYPSGELTLSRDRLNKPD